MSHTISSRSEIPNAPFYVLSNDKFMSGWGEAAGKVNTIILPCATAEQLDVVMENAQDRPEQKNVRYVIHKPRLREGVVYSLLVDDGSCYWYHTGRPFAHHRKGRGR